MPCMIKRLQNLSWRLVYACRWNNSCRCCARRLLRQSRARNYNLARLHRTPRFTMPLKCLRNEARQSKKILLRFNSSSPFLSSAVRGTKVLVATTLSLPFTKDMQTWHNNINLENCDEKRNHGPLCMRQRTTSGSIASQFRGQWRW